MLSTILLLIIIIWRRNFKLSSPFSSSFCPKFFVTFVPNSLSPPNYVYTCIIILHKSPHYIISHFTRCGDRPLGFRPAPVTVRRRLRRWGGGSGEFLSGEVLSAGPRLWRRRRYVLVRLCGRGVFGYSGWKVGLLWSGEWGKWAGFGSGLVVGANCLAYFTWLLCFVWTFMNNINRKLVFFFF